MGDAARDRRTGAPLPVSLHELLATVGPHPQAYDPWAASTGTARDTHHADTYLSVTLRGQRCLLPLGLLRGVLAERPRVVRVPRAPRWLLGVFPYRAELVALVDPAPVLFGDAAGDGRSGAAAGAPHARAIVPGDLEGAVVIVGSGERSLGWLVERAGALSAAGETAASATTSPADGPPILGAFTADPPTVGEMAKAATVLDVEAAVDALLAGLVEEGGHE